MAELEVTREVYEQFRDKLKTWRQEQRRLLAQAAQETSRIQEKPSRDFLRLQAQLEEVRFRISQLETKLQSVHIVDQHRPEE